MPDDVMMQAYESLVQVNLKTKSRTIACVQLNIHFKCAISNGLIDPDYIMCGHQDVKTSSASPGYRFQTNWVKKHSHFGERSPGGVSNSVTDGERGVNL